MLNIEGGRPSIAIPQYIRSETYVCAGDKGISHAVALRSGNQQSLPLRRGSLKSFQDSTMPITTSSQSLVASFPSLMSVFGDSVDTCQSKENDAVSHAPAKIANIAKRPPYNTNYSSPLLRRDSASTFESIESSPTTTISTLGSSVTEPSPSSSPESPISLSPLSSFKSLRAGGISMEGREHDSNPFASVSNLSRADSPNKKMRNTKNLSVNTSASSRQTPQFPRVSLSNMSATAPGRPFSAPPTPSFIVPPKPPRKRPSNLGLTIETPDSTTTSQTVHNGIGIPPPTPADPQLRTFRFLQSASTMPPISSPTVAPEGGMRLPPFAKPSIPSRLGKGRSGIGLSHSYEGATSPITVQTLEHVQEENDYELPLSREAKSPAYPEGPVCIYDPHVYLYLEPSDTEASKFDVVLNVAREVVNPFGAATENAVESNTKDAAVQASFGSGNVRLLNRETMSEPQTAVSDKSFRSAFESLPEEVVAISSSPGSLKAPEYIHIPWDHNSNVVDDLLKLCELIDNRVKNGSRVLVHCQCGVSRSASLVIAYGLYKNPQLTVHDAYNAVKSRSRWIGPNMNLIYQLTDFKKKLAERSAGGSSDWRSSLNIGSGHANAKATLFADLNSPTRPPALRSVQTEPTSAPFQKDHESTPARAMSFSPPGSTQVVEASAVGDISPGPSSAPSKMHWIPSEQVPDSKRELVTQTRDDQHLEPSSRSQTMDSDLLSQMKTSMSVPNIMDFGPSNLTLRAEAPSRPMGTHTIQQEPNSLSPLDTTNLMNTESEPTSLSPLKLSDSPVAEPEPGQTLLPGSTEIDPLRPSSSPAPPTKPTDINIIPQDPNSIPSPASKAIETAIRLPPSFTSEEYKTARTAPQAPPIPPIPTLPAGFSSLSARRAKSSLHLRGEASNSLRPKLSLISLNNPALENLPPTPSLLSPRAAEFTASPFHRTTAGDLAGSSLFEQQALMSPRAVEEDPRSPAVGGGAPITRSIFDVL